MTHDHTLRIGTRGSALALWQAETVQALLGRAWPELSTELTIIKPEGDLDKHSSLRQIGGRGVFTSALQERMLADEIDIAVHSTKDLPSLAPHGIAIAAFPQREDARDALISRHGVGLAELPHNPVIGTSSRRRSAQILQVRPDADIRELRGNIDTRLRKGMSEDFDAVVLAAAGLTRMGWTEEITQLLPVEMSCPAPGQGALAIEARFAPDAAWEIAASLDNADIRAAVAVERAFLRGVGGGCSTPIGAHAVVERMHGVATVRFWGMLGAEDQSRLERMYAEWPLDTAQDRAFAAADDLMRAVQPQWTGIDQIASDTPFNVLVTGSPSHTEAMREALSDKSVNAFVAPTIQIGTTPVELPAEFDWLVITSKHAIPAVQWEQVSKPIAVVGMGTAEALRGIGVEPTLVAAGPGAGQLAEELLAAGIAGRHAVLVVSDIARDELSARLVDAGVKVTSLSGYTNTPVDEMDEVVRDEVAAGSIDAVTFASPSSVHAFVRMVGADLPALSSAAMIAIGPTTAEAMEAARLPVHGQAQTQTVDGLVQAIDAYFGRKNSKDGE